MSDDEQNESSDTQLLTAEYKDGQLEIVEVSQYDKGRKQSTADVCSDNSSDGTKYVQVLDADKNMVVDLLNFTLVRGEDGEESFRLITNDGDENESDTTVTCVLSNEDGEDQDGQESYVMVDGDNGPLVFLQSSLQQANVATKKPEVKKPPLTPTEILEKAKALQKAKALLASQAQRGRARLKRKGDLPPAHELLSSPNFKLFLYSCKMCSFKCNAVKELTAHKAAEHSSGGGKYRGGARASTITLQCARCPYRGTNHTQLMNHVQRNHVEKATTTITNKVYLDSAEVEAADVLVCGACGFESGSRDAFRRHIEAEHGATC